MKNEMPNQDQKPEGNHPILFRHFDDVPQPLHDVLMEATNAAAMALATQAMKDKHTVRDYLGTMPHAHDTIVGMMKSASRASLCSYNNVGAVYVLIGFTAYTTTIMQHVMRCIGCPVHSMEVETTKDLDADQIVEKVQEEMRKARTAEDLDQKLSPKKPSAN
jgi:hypothetical protein